MTPTADGPVVRVRYEVRVDGIAHVGRVAFPADEWEAMGETERSEAVRAAALAARIRVGWRVEGPGGDPPRTGRRVEPSMN